MVYLQSLVCGKNNFSEPPTRGAGKLPKNKVVIQLREKCNQVSVVQIRRAQRATDSLPTLFLFQINIRNTSCDRTRTYVYLLLLTLCTNLCINADRQNNRVNITRHFSVSEYLIYRSIVSPDTKFQAILWEWKYVHTVLFRGWKHNWCNVSFIEAIKRIFMFGSML